MLAGVRVGERRAHAGLTVFWLHAPAASTSWAVSTLDEAARAGRAHRQRAGSGRRVRSRDRKPRSGARAAARRRDLAGRKAEPHRGRGRPDSAAERPADLAGLLRRARPVAGSRQAVQHARDARRAASAREDARAHRSATTCGPRSTATPGAWPPHRRRAATRRSPTSPRSRPSRRTSRPRSVERSRRAHRAPRSTSATRSPGSISFRTARCSRASGRSSCARARSKRTAARSPTPTTSRLRTSLDELLKAAAGAAGSVRRGVGAGWLVELRMSRAKGSALVAESQVVHVAMI